MPPWRVPRLCTPPDDGRDHTYLPKRASGGAYSNVSWSAVGPCSNRKARCVNEGQRLDDASRGSAAHARQAAAACHSSPAAGAVTVQKRMRGASCSALHTHGTRHVRKIVATAIPAGRKGAQCYSYPPQIQSRSGAASSARLQRPIRSSGHQGTPRALACGWLRRPTPRRVRSGRLCQQQLDQLAEPAGAARRAWQVQPATSLMRCHRPGPASCFLV